MSWMNRTVAVAVCWGVMACGGDGPTLPTDEPPVAPEDQVGAWVAGPSLPGPRMRHASAVYRGELYVAGGIVGPGQATASVVRLEPGAAAWSPVADLPYELAGPSLVVAADTLFAVGGDGPPFGVGDKLLLAYDVDRDTWERRATIPDGRLEAEAIELDGEIWLTGGTVRRDGYHFPDIPGELVLRYRPASGDWVYDAAIPSPRLDHEAVVAGDDVYLIGGRVPGVTNQNAQMDRLAAGTWRTVADSFATHRLAAAYAAPLVHVVGGVGTLDWHRAFDPRDQTWHRLPGLPYPMEWSQLVSWDGALWLIGGYEAPPGDAPIMRARVLRLPLEELAVPR